MAKQTLGMPKLIFGSELCDEQGAMTLHPLRKVSRSYRREIFIKVFIEQLFRNERQLPSFGSTILAASIMIIIA